VNHFPDSDTGYYDAEPAYLDEDARFEAQLADEEDRFEYEAQAMQETLWAGPIAPYPDDSPVALPPRRVMRSSNQQKEIA
jgi:hypothetical protein